MTNPAPRLCRLLLSLILVLVIQLPPGNGWLPLVFRNRPSIFAALALAAVSAAAAAASCLGGPRSVRGVGLVAGHWSPVPRSSYAHRSRETPETPEPDGE